MELRRVLGDFVLAESWFEDLRGIMKSLHIMRHMEAERAMLIAESETERRLGIALKSDESIERNEHKSGARDAACWIIFTDIFADGYQKKQFEQISADILSCVEHDTVHIGRKEFIESIIEYFSTGLVKGFLCDCDMKERAFYSKERVKVLKNVLSKFIRDNGIGSDSDTVEICCGDGAATIALHELGISPIAADINKCEICRGLREGVLDPKRSVVLNCAHLSHFFPNAFDCLFGFMLGKITPFNLFEWEPVIRDIPNALKNNSYIFLSFSSEWEAEKVKSMLRNFNCETFKNENSDGYFDHWILTGVLSTHP